MQLSCAMSSSFDTPFPAVTHENQSSSATTLAAVARAIVFAPQRSPIWFPKPMISVSQLTSPIQFPKPEESRRTDSNSGYPKLGLVPLLTRFIGCPTNREGSQRLRIWLPKCQLVPQRSFRAVSRSKSRLKLLSHRSVARTMSNTSGPTHRPVTRSMNLPGSLIFQLPGR